jgi:hypothetical protein
MKKSMSLRALYKADVDALYPCSPLPDCQPAEDRD